MTVVYLVRHGETEWNHAGLLQGTADIPLNAAGRAQAAALAKGLEGVDFDAAFTSPLRRARDTADAIVADRRVPMAVVPELREMSYGLWQGRGTASRVRCAPGLEWAWRNDPASVRFPGGESLHEVAGRACAAWDRIVADHEGRTVLVSAHGHVNRLLLMRVFGWPLERFWTIAQPNACCCRVGLGGAAPTLSRLAGGGELHALEPR
ncbi:MAG: histidine phosphatase family protein [Gemmatimonadetes bacterium]|nr:histidine phosphatase family protein [Gemmatimonadota bacterium]